MRLGAAGEERKDLDRMTMRVQSQDKGMERRGVCIPGIFTVKSRESGTGPDVRGCRRHLAERREANGVSTEAPQTGVCVKGREHLR